MGRVDLPRAIPDDMEVVPPKSNKQIQRSLHRSMPSPLIDDEAKKSGHLSVAACYETSGDNYLFSSDCFSLFGCIVLA